MSIEQTRHILETARLEKRSIDGVHYLRNQLRTNAADCAYQALYNWVAREVEACNANRGWIFLADREDNPTTLYSIPEASVRTTTPRATIGVADHKKSIVAYVFKHKEEVVTNNVFEDELAGRPYTRLELDTHSELAVPLFDSDENVIGVLNLEANRTGAFTNVQACEVKARAALIGLHLNVVMDLRTFASQAQPEKGGRDDRLCQSRKHSANRPAEGWVFHPAVDHWKPGVILGRYCHSVSRQLGSDFGTRPSCSIWYQDPYTRSCWVLGTCGYDYDFVDKYMLTPTSAIAQTAADPKRLIRRGTPEALQFEAALKAALLGVDEVILASIHVNEDKLRSRQPLRGVLAVYSFNNEKGHLPGDDTVRQLVRQAELLLAAVYRQRRDFGMAHLRAETAKSVSAYPSFRLFHRALAPILPHDAASIYATEKTSDKRGEELTLEDLALRRVHRYGLETGSGSTDHLERSERANLISLTKKSISGYCAQHADEPIRINLGVSDPIYDRIPELPKPDPESFESLDASFEANDRRRLAIGVKGAPEEFGAYAQGVIRFYRSGHLPPFTHLDEDLLRDIALSSVCRPLFANWRRESKRIMGPYGFGSISNRQKYVLRKASDKFDGRFDLEQAVVFVDGGQDSDPRYRWFAYYTPTPRRTSPDEIFREPLQGWIRDKITVVPYSSKATKNGERVCIPINVWSGHYLVNAVCCFDFKHRLDWDSEMRAQIAAVGVRAAAYFTDNSWHNPPICPNEDKRLLDSFREFVTRRKGELIHAEYVPLTCDSDARAGHESYPWESSLKHYGVRIHDGGARIAFPLYAGTFRVLNLLCQLDDSLASRLKQAIDLRQHAGESPIKNENDRVFEAEVYRRLQKIVGRVTGAWCKIVALNVSMWPVRFPNEPERLTDEVTIWHEKIGGRCEEPSWPIILNLPEVKP